MSKKSFYLTLCAKLINLVEWNVLCVIWQII